MSRTYKIVLLLVLLSQSAALVQADDLAAQARQILNDRCFSCHGEGGANEGGFNYALNRKRLVRELVIPGNADDSILYQRVSSGEMPPEGDRLSAEETKVLQEWITADVPTFSSNEQREFISPEDTDTLMFDDLEKANERNRPFYRYFTLTHLYNAGFEDNELESHRQGLSKLVNSLSWGREIRVPVPVDEHKTVLRIDLRHYKWQPGAWDQIVAANPYLVKYSSPAADGCRTMTKTEHPHARGDWFVHAASRPPLYHVLLELPDTPEKFVAFEKDRLGVDVARHLEEFNDVIRAGFYPSGVSKSNRLIERHVSAFGAYWKSYDFKPVDVAETQPKRRNLKAHPTGPDGEAGFQHDGGEMIFSLPNGLQGYLLTDSNNLRIDKGPTDVVVDKEAVKRGRDPEVINGVSCMNCHWSGTLNKTDQIRDHVLAQPAGTYPESVVEFVQAIYAPKDEFARRLKEDRERFEAAVLKCGAQLSKSEPVATLAFHFEEPLDLDLAAAESGVPVQKFMAALKSNDGLSRELGSLSLGQPIPRDTYVQQFPILVKQLQVGTFVPTGAKSIQTAKVESDPAMPPVDLPPGDTPETTAGKPKPVLAKTTPTKPEPGPKPTPAQPSDPFAGIEAGELKAHTDLKIKFRWCPPGSFEMGTPGATDHEAPISVAISHGFWMGQTEVNEGQWHAIMKSAPWRGKEFAVDGSERPVTYVSHGDIGRGGYSADSASEFCRRLNERETAAGRLPAGWQYVLPTEAQWEYACRAETNTQFYCGDDETQLAAHAWYAGSVPAGQSVQIVGSKEPNAWGLRDMLGNVREWCSDGYRSQLPGGRNPFVAFHSRLKGAPRISRGSGWRDDAATCRSAHRHPAAPTLRNSQQGFRLCLCIPGGRSGSGMLIAKSQRPGSPVPGKTIPGRPLVQGKYPPPASPVIGYTPYPVDEDWNYVEPDTDYVDPDYDPNVIDPDWVGPSFDPDSGDSLDGQSFDDGQNFDGQEMDSPDFSGNDFGNGFDDGMDNGQFDNGGFDEGSMDNGGFDDGGGGFDDGGGGDFGGE